MKSHGQLVRIFNRFNVKFFAGELPDVGIHYEALGGAYGDCDCVDGIFTVRIDPSCGGWSDFLRLTILHEMVHVKLWPYQQHGGKFDSEIVRLMGFKEIRKLI